MKVIDVPAIFFCVQGNTITINRFISFDMYMNKTRFGYACINIALAEENVRVNRSMMKRSYQEHGIKKASELALKNVSDLEQLIDWNIRNELLLYRMSSDMFPWMSEYELDELPAYVQLKNKLNKIGDKAANNNVRMTYHPGPFNVLASPDQSVVSKTIKELRQHAEIMDMLNLPHSPYAKINIHIGGTYGDKDAALKRFISNFSRLPDNVKSRLTIENDDKPQMYSTKDLYVVYLATGIPLVFDYFHHSFNTGGLSEEQAVKLSCSTWPKDVTPIVHYSSSRREYEDKKASPTSHADYIYDSIPTYGQKVDIMLEAKAKEKAVLQYRTKYKA